MLWRGIILIALYKSVETYHCKRLKLGVTEKKSSIKAACKLICLMSVAQGTNQKSLFVMFVNVMRIDTAAVLPGITGL